MTNDYLSLIIQIVRLSALYTVYRMEYGLH